MRLPQAPRTLQPNIMETISLVKRPLTLLAAGLLPIMATHAGIYVDTVVVGNAGNAADSTTYGSVAYEYRIGTHEVTNGQYVALLNAVAATDTHALYNPSMSSDTTNGGITRNGVGPGSYTYAAKGGFENKPVNYVSFWDAARFANWLTNGQPTGAQSNLTTENGMYALGGMTNPFNPAGDRLLDFSLGQNGVAIASENEWYKAAYFNGSNPSYSAFPTRSGTYPTATTPNSSNGNSANYNMAVGSVTDVGGYSVADSFYGTFDQGGNVWEWNNDQPTANTRGLRGDSFRDDGTFLLNSERWDIDPNSAADDVGFRISSLAVVPEPSTFTLLLGSLAIFLALARRRRGRSCQ